MSDSIVSQVRVITVNGHEGLWCSANEKLVRDIAENTADACIPSPECDGTAAEERELKKTLYASRHPNCAGCGNAYPLREVASYQFDVNEEGGVTYCREFIVIQPINDTAWTFDREEVLALYIDGLKIDLDALFGGAS